MLRHYIANLLMLALLMTATSAHALPKLNFRFIFGRSAKDAPVTESDAPAANQQVLEIESQIIPEGADLNLVVDEASRKIAQLRKENPGLGPISINLVKWNPNDTTGVGEEVATMLQTSLTDSRKFVIEPTKNFHKTIKLAETNLYESDAEQRAVGLKWKISMIRFTSSTVMTSVSLFIANAPITAIVAGAVTAGLISKSLLDINTYGNKFVNRNPWFDKDGSRVLSGTGQWRLAYGSWKLLKQSAISLGFITSIHVVTCVFGGEAAMLNSGVTWLSKAYLLGALPAALSFGKLKQIEHDVYETEMKENAVRNFSDREAGIDGAYKALRRSYVSALIISALAVGCETLSLTSGWALVGSVALQITVGTYAFAEYALRKSSHREWVLDSQKKFLDGIRRKRNFLLNGCASLFGR